jgi:predicted DNA-binding transcriptional regulator AlpA
MSEVFMSENVRQAIGIKGVRMRVPFSNPTLWRKIRTGEFPAPRYIGGRRYWWADEIDAWLQVQMQTAPQSPASAVP